MPCPVCETSWARHTDPSERSEDVQYFDMEDCVLTAIERDFISCPRHPYIPVPLQELVPELFMTDFPARYATVPMTLGTQGFPSKPREQGATFRFRLPEGNQAVGSPFIWRSQLAQLSRVRGEPRLPPCIS